MQIRNTQDQFGLVAISLHWLIALALVGLYLVGDYMVGLSYYDPAYRTLPSLHKSIGVILVLFILFRIFWRLGNKRPRPIKDHPSFENLLATLAHGMLYLLMIIIPVSGYLISTADGRSIDVFGLFAVPALQLGIEQQEELAGDLHRWSANLLMILAALHALAALKHHFLDKDRTLARMLTIKKGVKP